MRILFAWALGLGLCAGLVFATEPDSKKKPQGAPRVKLEPADEDQAEGEGDGAVGRTDEPESDDAAPDEESKEGEEKPSAGKKAPRRGAAANDLEIRKKASYLIAVDKVRELEAMGVEIVLDDFIQGLKDELAGKAKLPSEAERRETWLAMEQIMTERKAEMDRVTGEKFKKEGKAFLAANKNKEGVKTTKSGLQYKVLKSGKGGKSPTMSDIVTAHYKATFTNGDEFDSSYRHGKPQTRPLSKFLPGWIEALRMMKVGDKWRVVIPADLAFGAAGMKDPNSGQQMIPPNATLIFDIELLAITAADE